MTAALILPVSGPYTGTWGNPTAFALGTQNDDGFVLVGAYTGQEINASDQYGMTLVEAIYRGLNWRMRMRGLEFNKPGMLAAIQAYGSSGTSNTTFTPSIGVVGSRCSANAQSLVLTAILGNPPTFVQTLTALLAAPAPNSNIEYMFTSKVREAPLEMILLPYASVVGSLTTNVSFTTT